MLACTGLGGLRKTPLPKKRLMENVDLLSVMSDDLGGEKEPLEHACVMLSVTGKMGRLCID